MERNNRSPVFVEVGHQNDACATNWLPLTGTTASSLTIPSGATEWWVCHFSESSECRNGHPATGGPAASSVVLAWALVLLLTSLADEAAGTLADGPGFCRRVGPKSWWVGWGRSSVTEHVPGERDKPSVLFVSSSVTSNRNALVAAGWVCSAMPVFSAIACWPRARKGWCCRSGDCWCFCCCRGSYGRAAPDAMLAMALLSLLWPTPWYRAGCQGPCMAFRWFFSVFSQSGALTSVLYGHAGPLYFYLLGAC